MIWPLFLLSLSAIAAVYGEPRPVALVIAGVGVVTAAVDYLRGPDR